MTEPEACENGPAPSLTFTGSNFRELAQWVGESIAVGQLWAGWDGDRIAYGDSTITPEPSVALVDLADTFAVGVLTGAVAFHISAQASSVAQPPQQNRAQRRAESKLVRPNGSGKLIVPGR